MDAQKKKKTYKKHYTASKQTERRPWTNIKQTNNQPHQKTKYTPLSILPKNNSVTEIKNLMYWVTEHYPTLLHRRALAPVHLAYLEAIWAMQYPLPEYIITISGFHAQ